MELLDLLDRRDRPETGLFWGSRRTSWSEVWDDATRVQAFVQSHGGAVASVLTNEPVTASVLLGGLLSGGTVASLPLPPRQESPFAYAARMEELCVAAGIELLLVADALVDLLPPLERVQVASFSTAASFEAARAVDTGCGRFVQFTSGTSAAPRGVVLGGDQLAENVVRTVEIVQPGDRWQSCSWLPLSHDMGLIGMLLIPWAMSAGVTLRDPVTFLADPLVWLDDLHARRVQVTATPSFGLEMVIRHLGRKHARSWDLSNVATIIVGAEPIPVDLLHRFADALAPYGLPAGAISPAYGMAEACLAVSLSAPYDPWRAAVPDAGGTWRLVDGASCVDPGALVACGPVLAGYELTVTDGRFHVDGPAVTAGYLGEPPRTEPHDTRDEGFLVDGEPVVVGRSDDVLFVRGRKLQPVLVERAVADLVRPGTAAAVADIDGTFAVVAEPSDPTRIDRAAAARVRTAVSRAVGLAPTRVVFLAKGAALKTTSGKIQRRRTLEWLTTDRLDIVADHRTVNLGDQ